jgi:hypothetical protein
MPLPILLPKGTEFNGLTKHFDGIEIAERVENVGVTKANLPLLSMSALVILLGILIELTIILLIDYTPWGNAIFGTAPIPVAVWLFTVPFALGMLMLEELRKWFVRSFV